MAPPRPRWEANKKQAPAKAQKAPKVKAATPAPAQSIPLELQQLLLNIFKDSFAERFEQDIKPLLQEVKGHLYNRDFATAFGKNEYLETYAARWSASRALGYADLFWDLREHLWPKNARVEDGSAETANASSKSRKTICLGGGAGAEVVALAAVQKMLSRPNDDDSVAAPVKMDVEAIDMADWRVVVEQLHKHITHEPPLSKYASASVKASNAALIEPGSIDVSFQQHDVLLMDPSALSTTLENTTLVALLFTLNELYSTSVALTQKFLLNLTSSLSTGAMLLVVDSPGSYSTVMLNGTEKKYPMQWLLDLTLLNEGGSSAKDKDVKWEKVHEDESRWFRLDSSLRYPIELENMRMQIHLYRRL
ncbi:hypothetical protein DE146DRAFT_213065 [Phaeosphaeria sp. MPI-PUGE-AT-0046c]|nr:hypothetical protein DE146DRAFT_213065 [Phaeosphaeria sp. MPI-PUGE-AT-0046c]